MMYTLKDIEQISKTPYECSLDSSVLKLLREIDIIINDSKFRLRPEFKYKSKIIVNRDKINGLIDSLRLNMNKLFITSAQDNNNDQDDISGKTICIDTKVKGLYSNRFYI